MNLAVRNFLPSLILLSLSVVTVTDNQQNSATVVDVYSDIFVAVKEVIHLLLSSNIWLVI